MKDRIPTRPNRRKITFEDDNTVKYAKIEYADEPIEEGTPLNKGNLLSDETALKFGLAGDSATVNNAFVKIADTPLHIPNNIALVRVTAKFSNGAPIVGAAVTGFTGLTNNLTNDKGQLLVQLSSITPLTIGIPVIDYIDEEVSATTATPIFGKVVDVEMIAVPKNEVRILTSKNFKISSAVAEMDVFLVGGGAGGSKGTYGYDAYYGGRGGSGGYTKTALNVPFSSGTTYLATVGTGGLGGTTTSLIGGSGGNTSAFGIVAQGGAYAAGGSGGGGGQVEGAKGGSNGANGVKASGALEQATGGTGQGTTTRAFGEVDGELFAGGGGGGGQNSSGDGGLGGGGNGGRSANGVAGGSNTGGGGGGAGYGGSTLVGAIGGSGVIIMRFRR